MLPCTVWSLHVRVTMKLVTPWTYVLVGCWKYFHIRLGFDILSYHLPRSSVTVDVPGVFNGIESFAKYFISNFITGFYLYSSRLLPFFQNVIKVCEELFSIYSKMRMMKHLDRYSVYIYLLLT